MYRCPFYESTTFGYGKCLCTGNDVDRTVYNNFCNSAYYDQCPVYKAANNQLRKLIIFAMSNMEQEQDDPVYKQQLLAWCIKYYSSYIPSGYGEFPKITDDLFKTFCVELIKWYKEKDSVICNPETAEKFIKETFNGEVNFHHRFSRLMMIHTGVDINTTNSSYGKRIVILIVVLIISVLLTLFYLFVLRNQF